MQKNSFYFIFYAFAWIPIFIMSIVLPGRPLDTGMVYFEGMWIILLLLGSMIVCEQSEGKSKGYDFLRTLPIKDSHIVKAKFFLVFLTACFVVVYITIIYLFVFIPPEVLAIVKVFIPLCAVVGILLDAFLYTLIFKIGFSKTIKIGWIIFVVIILGAFLFIELVLVKSDIDAGKISAFLNSNPLAIWIVLGLGVLAVYFGLMFMAIKAKKRNRG
jgi:hypothetical protein